MTKKEFNTIVELLSSDDVDNRILGFALGQAEIGLNGPDLLKLVWCKREDMISTSNQPWNLCFNARLLEIGEFTAYKFPKCMVDFETTYLQMISNE